jgi:hypothetical protein
VAGVGQPPRRTDDEEGDRRDQHLPEEADRSYLRAECAGTGVGVIGWDRRVGEAGPAGPRVGAGIQVMYAMMDAMWPRWRLIEVMAADLSGPDLVAVVVDGVGFAE